MNVGDVRNDRSWVGGGGPHADTGEPLPGYGCEDCGDICVDGLRRPVEWDGRGLADIGRDRFRLRFWLYGAARLYGYRFVDYH